MIFLLVENGPVVFVTPSAASAVVASVNTIIPKSIVSFWLISRLCGDLKRTKGRLLLMCG